MVKKNTLKRFYTEVTSKLEDDGYVVYLDSRKLNTPSGNAVILPNEETAQLVVEEFAKQGEELQPQDMFVTRLVNTTIDGVAADLQPIYEDILRITSYDLLLYRASYPEELTKEQEEAWDPILDWVKETTGANFLVTKELISIQQSKESLALFGNFLHKITNPFALTAFYTMTFIFKSSLLALALSFGELTLEDAWDCANIDEDWVDEQWQKDEEKESVKARYYEELTAAYNLFKATHK